MWGIECPNCGETEHFEWAPWTKNTGPAVDGRLRMHEVGVQFILGCESCSQTLRVVSGDDVAKYLTEQGYVQ